MMRRFHHLIWVCSSVILLTGIVSGAGDTWHQFSYSEAATRTVYAGVATQLGVEVEVAAAVKDELVSVEVAGALTPREVLEAFATQLGHVVTETRPGRFLVVDDTPQARRELEPLVIRTFALEHLPAREADRLLRTMIEARRVVTDERLNTVTVRDTEAKVAIAAQLFAVADKPDPAAELTVMLLEVDEATLAQGGALGAVWSAAQQTAAVAAGRVLWSGGLGLAGGESSHVEARLGDGGFELEAAAQPHAGSAELTVHLNVRADLSIGDREGRLDKREGSTRTAVRLVLGEAAVVRLPDAGGAVWRLLVVTPRSLRPVAFTTEDLAPFPVGTEARMSVGGGSGP